MYPQPGWWTIPAEIWQSTQDALQALENFAPATWR
jgi:hypothetical protein